MESVDNVLVANLQRLMEYHTADVLTQEKIAKICGVKQNAVSSWLTGRTRPRIATLKRLADYYHLPIDWFVTDPSVSYRTPGLSLTTYEDCYKTLIHIDHALLGDSSMKVSDPIIAYLVTEYLRLLKQTKNGDLSSDALAEWQLRVHHRFAYCMMPLSKKTIAAIRKKVAVADEFETYGRMVRYISDHADELQQEKKATDTPLP